MWASRLWHGHFMRGAHRPSDGSHNHSSDTATGTEGPLSPLVGRRFRKLVLERGNAAHARVLLDDFLGQGGIGSEQGDQTSACEGSSVSGGQTAARGATRSDSAEFGFAASVDQWVRADIEGECDQPLSSLSSSPPRSSSSTRSTL